MSERERVVWKGYDEAKAAAEKARKEAAAPVEKAKKRGRSPVMPEGIVKCDHCNGKGLPRNKKGQMIPCIFCQGRGYVYEEARAVGGKARDEAVAQAEKTYNEGMAQAWKAYQENSLGAEEG